MPISVTSAIPTPRCDPKASTTPCSSASCGTASPLRFDEQVDVHLLLASASRASFQMSYLLTVDGEVRATAVTVHGCITAAGRPTRLPEWLTELVS